MLKSIIVFTALAIASAYAIKKITAVEKETGGKESPTLNKIKVAVAVPVVLAAAMAFSGLLPLTLATIAFPITIPALILSQGFRELYITLSKRVVIGAIPLIAFAVIYKQDSEVSI